MPGAVTATSYWPPPSAPRCQQSTTVFHSSYLRSSRHFQSWSLLLSFVSEISMEPIDILHVTDFHIRSADDSDSPLCAGTQLENYVRSLVAVIRNEAKASPKYIVVSGDFVEHFDFKKAGGHAHHVIRLLSTEFGVPLDRIIICPGNHDYNWNDQDAGNEDRAREDYYSFAKDYARPVKAIGNLACIHRFDDDRLAFLSFDSTLRAYGQSTGEITD